MEDGREPGRMGYHVLDKKIIPSVSETDKLLSLSENPWYNEDRKRQWSAG